VGTIISSEQLVHDRCRMPYVWTSCQSPNISCISRKTEPVVRQDELDWMKMTLAKSGAAVNVAPIHISRVTGFSLPPQVADPKMAPLAP